MINDLLKQRILRKLDTLDDERAYQVLDFVEFLESRYAQRGTPGGILDRITETVEDVMRAGRLPVKAVSGTMSVVDTATKLMKGVAAAGQAAVEEAVRAVGEGGKSEPPRAPETPAAGPGNAPSALPSKGESA
jgi:hypothetical protein